MEGSNIKEVRQSVEHKPLVLIVVLALSTLVSTLGTFGIYWLHFGGFFAYEGGYFLIPAVFLSPFFIPPLIYYFVWPKPKVNRLLRIFFLIPSFLLMLCVFYYFSFYR